MKRILSFFLAIVLGLNPIFQAAFAQTIVPSVLGQVGDDTDIFLINPNVSSDRPNVLIIWDNTANWGQTVAGTTAYALEKQALTQVINGLDDRFNVGLMLYTETGGGNSNVRGAYPRFHIQQMTDANKTRLIDEVNSLDQSNDRGSNAQYARALYEAYLYYGGKPAMAGAGQVKRDYDAFGGDASGTTYVSPISGACQKNYIIFITNGPSDSGENNSAESILTTLKGKLNNDPIQINPDAEEANWADEYSRYIYNNDARADRPGSKITTFTLSVFDTSRRDQRPTASMNALMNSAATQGKGKYYEGVDLASIVEALQDSFDKINADDSVFTSTTLPVSVNVRGTQLNQVYMGVFRPDSNMSPRWFGNLKMYKLGLDTATQTVFLADANGDPAENASSGFINPTALSHWTVSQDPGFWAFRDAAENGSSGANDAPDGDKVEKGAVGQQLRITYATDQSTRNLYTCTGTCTVNSSLSSFGFTTANGDITEVALGVDTAPDPTTARTDLISWIRGQDNLDENGNGSTTDVRASIHGDVLHSRPALINYNRNSPSDDNDVIAFYGANDGVFRAVQGGFNTGAGAELWGFIPSEVFGRFKRLRDNSQAIDISNKRPYFMDGPIGIYQDDNNDDGKLVAADGDKVHLYVGMRRGGRLIYALDVSNPTDPRFLWKKTITDTGFAELGYTWSEPKVTRIRAHTSGPVIIMGAGYDPNQDNDPVTPGTDTMGRGVMVLDALTGELLWQVGASPSGATQGNLQIAEMNSSIPSDVTILDRNSDGFTDRVYVGDTGGNVWRIDIHSDVFADWTAVKLATVGGSADADRRKFMYPPDVVFSKDANGPYDAVLIGSGDREHPFNTTVVNRYYMFKDRVTGLESNQNPAIVEGDLFDATSNVIQVGNDTDSAAAKVDLSNASGWMMTLGTGEKVISGSVTLAGTTFFNTNTPAAVDPNVCSAQGTALQYAISFEDATATIDSGQAGLTTADRAITYAGGGYLPSPVPVVVNLGGRLYQAVISGPQVRMPPQAKLESRFRTYWYITND